MVSSTKKIDVKFLKSSSNPAGTTFSRFWPQGYRLALPYLYHPHIRIFHINIMSSTESFGFDIFVLSKNLSNSPAARIALLRLERNHHALASCHPMKKGFRTFKEHRKTSTSSAKFRLAVSNPKTTRWGKGAKTQIWLDTGWHTIILTMSVLWSQCWTHIHGQN